MAISEMSLSRVKVREFIKLANNTKWQIEIKGTRITALRFVQAMRVELSRMRRIVRNRGRVVKPFTMSLISIDENYTDKLVTITLLKKSEHAELSAEVNEILNDLDGGALIK